MVAEIVSFDRHDLVFERARRRSASRLRGGQVAPEDADTAPDINVFQVWAAQFARPLIVGRN